MHLLFNCYWLLLNFWWMCQSEQQRKRLWVLGGLLACGHFLFQTGFAPLVCVVVMLLPSGNVLLIPCMCRICSKRSSGLNFILTTLRKRVWYETITCTKYSLWTRTMEMKAVQKPANVLMIVLSPLGSLVLHTFSLWYTCAYAYIDYTWKTG